MGNDLLVRPGDDAALSARDARHDLGLDKQAGNRELEQLRKRLEELQERLFAEGRRSLLLVLQGLDASGKDGVIRSVFDGVNPQGCRVVSFRAPTSTELSHDYLWRLHAQLPARGEIGIFNRSHYEDIVAVRMHRLAPEHVWRRRSGHLRDWERMLTDEGTVIVKAFLNVSREEQLRRFKERLDDPRKRWKFRKDDLEVAKRYDEYVDAWDEAITETSTDWAPWHVIPANSKTNRNLLVLRLLIARLKSLELQHPDPAPGLDEIQVL